MVESMFMLNFVDGFIAKDDGQTFSDWLIIQMERIQCIFKNSDALFKSPDRIAKINKLNAMYQKSSVQDSNKITEDTNKES